MNKITVAAGLAALLASAVSPANAVPKPDDATSSPAVPAGLPNEPILQDTAAPGEPVTVTGDTYGAEEVPPAVSLPNTGNPGESNSVTEQVYGDGAPDTVYGIMAFGQNHALAIDKLGQVWSWGENGNGQLGDGTNSRRTAPVQVPGLQQATAVSAGAFYSLALTADGTLWAWGSNSLGELGADTVTSRAVPIPVLQDVAGMASGIAHTMALKKDGTVWSWGLNNKGQLGADDAVKRSSGAGRRLGRN